MARSVRGGTDIEQLEIIKELVKHYVDQTTIRERVAVANEQLVRTNEYNRFTLGISTPLTALDTLDDHICEG